MSDNHDLEIYLATGKLPPCFYCHKKDGVKAKLNFNWFGEAYLEWCCNDCLDSGEHITKDIRICCTCGKHISKRNIYILDPSLIFCSKKCVGDEHLDLAIRITKDSVCPNCEKPFNRDDLYFLNDSIYCSKDCANEYEGYYGIDHWNEISEEFKKNTGKGIHIS